MKIIKSKLYIKKEAIYSNMPVGDPGLPGQLRETDMPVIPDPDIVESPSSGEIPSSEITVNWHKFAKWYEASGDMLPKPFTGRVQPSTVKLEYSYSYDHKNTGVDGTGSIQEIKPVKLMDYETKQTNFDPYFLKAFLEYDEHEKQIKYDIEIMEERNITERQPGFNPFEV